MLQRVLGSSPLFPDWSFELLSLYYLLTTHQPQRLSAPDVPLAWMPAAPVTASTPPRSCVSILVPGNLVPACRVNVPASPGSENAAAASAAAYLMLLREPEGAAGGDGVNNNLL